MRGKVKQMRKEEDKKHEELIKSGIIPIKVEDLDEVVRELLGEKKYTVEDVEKEWKELEEAHKSGEISEEEFEERKKELLRIIEELEKSEQR